MRSWTLAWVVALAMPVAAHAELTADERVEQGIQKRAEGKDAEALALFESAYAMVRAPRTLAQIGLAEQALGRWRAAYEHLSSALAERGDRWIQEHRATLEGALAVIDGRLARLELTSTVDGVTARVDGGAWVKVPSTVRADPAKGKVKVEARAPGYTGATLSVSVSAGAQVAVPIALAKAIAAAPSPSPSASPKPSEKSEKPSEPAPSPKPAPTTPPPVAPEPSSGGSLAPLAWVAGGAGAIALIAGVVLAATSEADPNGCYIDELGELVCPNGGQTAGIALLVTGVVLGAGGVTLFVLDDDGDPSATARAVTLTGCGVSGAQVACAFSF